MTTSMPLSRAARLRRLLRSSLVVLLLLAAAATVVLRKLEEHALYPIPVPDMDLRAPDTEVWELPGLDGSVHALYLQPEPGQRTIVTFHGNGHQLGAMLGWAAQLKVRGLGALLVEYPGYGLSSSRRPSEDAIYEDASTALQFLIKHRGVANADIVLLGESLGTGVAVEMAQRGFGGRAVLLSAYSSIPELAKIHAPWLPFPRLLANHFDSKNKAANVTQPVLLIHGEEDALIPLAMSRTLVERFPHAELITWKDVAHGGMISHFGDRVLDELARWSPVHIRVNP